MASAWRTAASTTLVIVITVISCSLVCTQYLEGLEENMQYEYENSNGDPYALMRQIHEYLWGCYLIQFHRMYQWRPLNITSYSQLQQEKEDKLYDEINQKMFPLLNTALKKAAYIKTSVIEAIDFTRQSCQAIIDGGDENIEHYKKKLKRYKFHVEWHDPRWNYLWDTTVSISPYLYEHLFFKPYLTDLRPTNHCCINDKGKKEYAGPSMLHQLPKIQLPKEMTEKEKKKQVDDLVQEMMYSVDGES